ncbi:HDOD domain-containing protein [Oxalobacteraceae bacterium OM1]|nr:HDOD domain-containing protein [Oxalobacteraceae bacterium OM1]
MANAAQTGTATPEQTMELLWQRVRQRGDLPGFSKVVGAIIGAMRGEDDREFNMTKTVLQDPALTQKVLRLANSAMYSVFGQGINTVSKAVIVLGTEAIGHLALGLKLIDGLSNASSASGAARVEMEKAVMAGHIARQVAAAASTRDAEEAVVCSMLHSLGRMMTTFYLQDRWQEIQARCTEGMPEADAARAVLGLGLDDIARKAAQQWGLPAGLIDTLQDVAPKPVGEPLDHNDWLAAVSTLSSRCADAICADEEDAAERVTALAATYADMLGVETKDLLAAVDSAQRTAVAEDPRLVRPTKAVLPGRKPEPAKEEKQEAPHARGGKPVDAAKRLGDGVDDIRDAVQTASTGQLLSMALETIYQGLGFSRAIAFLRNQEQSSYTARMCFGDGVQELLPRLIFGDAYQPDVFHAALANDKMIFVENALDANFVSKVPRWWKDALPSVRSFMVLPLTVNRQPVGFLYGDWDISAPLSRVEPAEVGPLNELRLLVVRAIEQRRQMEPGWMRRMS